MCAVCVSTLSFSQVKQIDEHCMSKSMTTSLQQQISTEFADFDAMRVINATNFKPFVLCRALRLDTETNNESVVDVLVSHSKQAYIAAEIERLKKEIRALSESFVIAPDKKTRDGILTQMDTKGKAVESYTTFMLK